MKKSKKSIQEAYSTESWMSFTDIMTGLLFIFFLIVMTMMFLNNKDRSEFEKRKLEFEAKLAEFEIKQEKFQFYVDEVNNQIKSPQEKIHKLMEKLTKNLRNNKVNVSIDLNNNVIHVLDSELRFESGEYKISDQYKKTVELLGNNLFTLLKDQGPNNVVDFIDTIFIEGHTDKVPYNNPNIFGNWGLSTLRAISVWEHIDQDRLSKFKNKDNKPLFSVSGYADTRPNPCSKDGDPNFRTEEACGDLSLVEHLSELESNEKNRRIDIRFVPYMDLNKINEHK